jgi:pseudouridine synthase
MKIRLNKYIADTGYCSRRQADEKIGKGKVKINGRVADELGTRVDPEEDSVAVEGDMIDYPSTPVIPRGRPGSGRKIYIMLNKPTGYVCTTRRFKGEKNVLDLVETKHRIYPVGRLDKESEGLMVLTNDGELTNKLTHPKFEHEKEYEVDLEKEFNKKDLQKIKKGLVFEGELLSVKNVKLASARKLYIILTQGKKRHLRRIFSKLGYNVIGLKRIRIGKLELGKLRKGRWEFIEKKLII